MFSCTSDELSDHLMQLEKWGQCELELIRSLWRILLSLEFIHCVSLSYKMQFIGFRRNIYFISLQTESAAFLGFKESGHRDVSSH